MRDEVAIDQQQWAAAGFAMSRCCGECAPARGPRPIALRAICRLSERARRRCRYLRARLPCSARGGGASRPRGRDAATLRYRPVQPKPAHDRWRFPLHEARSRHRPRPAASPLARSAANDRCLAQHRAASGHACSPETCTSALRDGASAPHRPSPGRAGVQMVCKSPRHFARLGFALVRVREV